MGGISVPLYLEDTEELGSPPQSQSGAEAESASPSGSQLQETSTSIGREKVCHLTDEDTATYLAP
jgi:hypothetical protein